MFRLDANCGNLEMVVSELFLPGDLKSIVLDCLEWFDGQSLRNDALGILIHRCDSSRLSHTSSGSWEDDHLWLSKF
jgi:hypothetical protein